MTTKTSWMTSFYFQQDLRSYYMNGLLNAGLKPGIYNANMSLLATSSSHDASDKNAGLFLFIKKGTTFIFSNNYDYTENKTVERNLNNIGNTLIKCVALEDTLYTLVTLAGNLQDFVKEYILGTNGNAASNRFYIIATLEYDKESGEGQEGEIYPIFRFAVNNPDYDSKEGAAYFKIINNQGVEVVLADGLKTDKFIQASDVRNRSYLIVGTVLNTNNNANYYISGNGWDNNGNHTSSVWMKSHVFVGRGLPEYRYSLITNTLEETPDLILDTGDTSEGTDSEGKKIPTKGYEDSPVVFKRVIIDLPSTIIGNRFIKNRYDWRKIYNIGPYSYSTDNVKSIDIKDYSSSEEKNKINKLGEGNYMITDFIYLSLKEKNSSLQDIDLETIYDSSELFTLKNYSWISILNKKDKTQKMTSARDMLDNILSDTGTTGSTNALTKGAFYENDKTFEDGILLPLDMNVINMERLHSIIENKNIIPAVVNKLRQEEEINPKEGDEIVPVALIFRGFTKDSNGKVLFSDISDYDRYDPNNVLCLFDLQLKSNKLNSLSTCSKESFSIIPVME